MANAAQKAILTAKLSGVLKDLMVKTNAEQVYLDDTTTLAKKLSELITALNGKAASSHKHKVADISDFTTSVNSAINTAINKLVDGAPETYDTLKEIADYIEAHKDVTDALNQAVGNKADKTTVETLSGTVTAIKEVTDSLGALAKKSSVAEADLDAALKTKINSVADKSKIYYSATEPTALADGDMWVQLIAD